MIEDNTFFPFRIDSFFQKEAEQFYKIVSLERVLTSLRHLRVIYPWMDMPENYKRILQML